MESRRRVQIGEMKGKNTHLCMCRGTREVKKISVYWCEGRKKEKRTKPEVS
jgi:hypothetical protein